MNKDNAPESIWRNKYGHLIPESHVKDHFGVEEYILKSLHDGIVSTTAKEAYSTGCKETQFSADKREQALIRIKAHVDSYNTRIKQCNFQGFQEREAIMTMKIIAKELEGELDGLSS